MGKQKYFTEEERKAARRESTKRWRKNNPDYCSNWYQKNKERLVEYRLNTKEHKSEYDAKYRETNKEKISEYRQNNKEEIRKRAVDYYNTHKDERHEYYIKYMSTKEGKAAHLLQAYRQNDKKYNRGKCTLTIEWIVDNIFSKPCHYCGESDWKELGCDRIDNSKPHTEDNVVCCCEECNKKRGRKEYNEFIKIIKEKNT